MNKTLVLAVAALCLVFSSAAYSWEDAFTDPRLKTTEGKVSDVDVQTSRITISSVDVMVFSVPTNVRVVQDIYDIKLSDIRKGDYVTIDYLEDTPGKREAQVITVHYREGEGI